MNSLFVNSTQGPWEVQVLMTDRGLAVTEHTGGVGWCITHVNTGMTLVDATFMEDTARRLCLVLASLTDWEGLTYDGMVRWLQHSTCKEAVRRALKAARAEDAS